LIRVLLVDDQVLFAETLQTVISMKADDIDVVEIAYNGQEAIEAALRLVPDIILMDVRMPVLDGVQAACKIHLNQPGIRIMMLTTFDDDAYVHDALEGGAVGYLLKNMPSDDLINSIRAVNNGTLQISPSVASQLVSSQKPISRFSGTEDHPVEEVEYNIDVLSRREREILYLMSRGYDNSHIAGRLFLADQTVKNHISRIYNKLDVHDRMSVMKAARHSELKEYCRYLLDDE
jgi:DNA-binding NarL/FixJ family response regulator